MKKFIATCIENVDEYPLDCFSIAHLISGFVAYFISFWLFGFFMIPLTAILLSYLSAFVGGIIWEFYENIFIVDMKRNHRPDSPLNSLTDVVFVFLGSIVGCMVYNTNWIFKMILIGSLFLSYAITRILTEKNSKNIKKSKKDKKSSKKPKNED